MACAGGPSTTSLWAALQVVGGPPARAMTTGVHRQLYPIRLSPDIPLRHEDVLRAANRMARALRCGAVV